MQISRRAHETDDARLLAQVLDQADAAIVATDLEGRITLWSGGAAALHGWTEEEAVGQPLSQMTLPPENRELTAGMLDSLRANGRWQGTVEMQRKDGRLFWASTRRSVLRDPGGVPVGLLGVTTDARDDSERRRNDVLEGRLDQAQRLESLGQLAGGIAHDFNNLLAVILNYAAFVAEQLEDGSATSNGVDEIRKAAEHASELTDQLLTFGRREVVTPQLVSVDASLREAENLLSRALGEQVTLEVDAVGGPQTVSIGAGQLDQVLLNLAVNARDAMPDGGTLLIRSGTVDVDSTSGLALPAGRYVRLSVCDSGSGMPAEVATQAFDPFFTTKPKGEGTGLGLATVYGLVTQAGGHVELASRPGQGTDVHIYLPVVEGTGGEAKPPPGDRPASGQSAAILLVEDDDALRRVTRRILAGAGHEVIEATDGEHALEISRSREEAIDLLLTDVVIPGMSGIELAAQLRAARPGLRVVCVSGYAGDEVSVGEQRTQEVIIQKPFIPRTLLATIEQSLADARGTRVQGGRHR